MESISLDSMSINEKILISVEKMVESLEYFKGFYMKTICEEEHWIYANIEELIENDENYEQNEIKILKSTSTLIVTLYHKINIK